MALTDRQSRSAKDALAHEFQRRRLATVVGERTAGAVIPASFAPIGEETVLMFPSFTLGDYTATLELKGVEPDVFVERAGPFSAGHDPILERGLREMARLVAEAPPRKEMPRADPPAMPAVSGGQALPTLDALVPKMIGALGGEKALRAHGHRTLTGTAELVGLPMKGTFTRKMSAPDRSLVVMRLGDLLVRQGFDGTTAWSETPMDGPQILRGAPAESLRRQASFLGPLDLLASNREVTPTGFVMFDGRGCIELKLVGASGAAAHLYVDAATFLIAGSRERVETPIGPVEAKTFLRDYRDLDGYRTATEIRIESSLQRQLIRIERIHFDPVTPDEYAPPKTAR